MPRLVIVAFFLALTAAAAAADVPSRPSESPSELRRPLPVPDRWQPQPAQDDEGYTECDGEGPGLTVCAANCTVVLLCMGGSLDPIVLEECEGDFSCNAQQGECVNGTSSCETVTSRINCHGLGMFPDPTDCTSYHICCSEDGQSVRAKCGIGYAYNPNTTLCSKKQTDDVCTNLPIECGRLGETNAFPGDANIYYICVADEEENLYPELYRCDNGLIYNPGTYRPLRICRRPSMNEKRHH